MDSRFMPEVLQAVPGDGYVIYAYFNDGTVRRYDAAKLVRKGGVFARLKERAFFTAALTVMNGTAAWDVTGTRDAVFKGFSDCLLKLGDARCGAVH